MWHGLVVGMGDDELKFFVIGGGLFIWAISIVFGGIHRTTRARQREQSRREIAAYVAEGSMSADDAAKLMADDDGASCGGKKKA